MHLYHPPAPPLGFPRDIKGYVFVDVQETYCFPPLIASCLFSTPCTLNIKQNNLSDENIILSAGTLFCLALYVLDNSELYLSRVYPFLSSTPVPNERFLRARVVSFSTVTISQVASRQVYSPDGRRIFSTQLTHCLPCRNIIAHRMAVKLARTPS